MSALELIGDWIQTLASSPSAPGGPGPLTGPAAGPALGAGAGGRGGNGGNGGNGGGNRGAGGDGAPGGDGGDGPPSPSDLFESAKDAVKELVGIADEVSDIATSDDRTADEEAAWGAGRTKPEDVVLGNVPGADKATEAAKYGKTAYEGIRNVKNYNSRRKRILDAIS